MTLRYKKEELMTLRENKPKILILIREEKEDICSHCLANLRKSV